MVEKDKSKLYEETLEFITHKFHGRYDKGGCPYMDHLFVSSHMKTIDGKILGLLHDVVEDIEGVTFETLLNMGYPTNIIEALKIVTRDKNVPYDDYINNIALSNNALAIELKKCDLTHNMDISRIPNSTEKDIKRLEKYKRNFKVIKKLITV